MNWTNVFSRKFSRGKILILWVRTRILFSGCTCIYNKASILRNFTHGNTEFVKSMKYLSSIDLLTYWSRVQCGYHGAQYWCIHHKVVLKGWPWQPFAEAPDYLLELMNDKNREICKLGSKTLDTMAVSSYCVCTCVACVIPEISIGIKERIR